MEHIRALEKEASAVVHRDWQAEMIAPESDPGTGGFCPSLVKEFELDSVPENATLFISAYGLYRVFINGNRVGDDQLTPGWTCYDVRLAYQSYDVRSHLAPGANKIEIWLADGWYRSPLMWGRLRTAEIWGDKIGAIAEIVSSGHAMPLVKTDISWKSGDTPIRKSGIYFGEIYDARVKPAVTSGVSLLPFDRSILLQQECQPVQELAPLPVVKSWQDDEGRTVYDFAQNAAGYVAFEVKGDAGSKVIVEHAEVLDQDGNFYNGNLRTAEARLEYTLNGRGAEHYRPHFTFQGFRYARVTVEGEAEIVSIAYVPISSVTDVAATFESGHPLLNRLVLNTLWSQRSNFIEVPTDCPQRDERMGWTGDAQVFASTACYLADSHGILAKFVRDMIADQEEDGAIAHFTPNPLRLKPSEGFGKSGGSTGWGDAISIIPYTLYLHYGDKGILAEAFPSMKRWNEYLWSISNAPIIRSSSGWGVKGFTFGDWLQPQNDFLKAVPTMGDDAAATVYFYISSRQIAEIAGILGLTDEAEFFSKRADAIREAFQHEFITKSGRLLYDDQTSYALAILHDLIPAEHLEAAIGYFKATIARAHGRIGTGFIGTPALLPALTKIGELGLAADMLLQEDVPGWLFQVKMGATTIWERWDGIKEDGSIFEPTMNSYNHYAYGAVTQWLLEHAAGFRPDPEKPAFEHIIFEPVIIPALSPVKAEHETPNGAVRVEWALENGIVTYDVSIPEGSSGQIVLAAAYKGLEPGLSGVERDELGRTVKQLGPGQHRIKFSMEKD